MVMVGSPSLCDLVEHSLRCDRIEAAPTIATTMVVYVVEVANATGINVAIDVVARVSALSWLAATTPRLRRVQ